MKKLFAILVFTVLGANAWADENTTTPFATDHFIEGTDVNCTHTHTTGSEGVSPDPDYGPEGG